MRQKVLEPPKPTDSEDLISGEDTTKTLSSLDFAEQHKKGNNAAKRRV